MLQGEHLHSREHEILIFTDSSNAGWGTHLGQNSTGGLWSLSEKHLHINLLEMKAVLLALQFFKTDCRNNQVLIASDNTSVVVYINKLGLGSRYPQHSMGKPGCLRVSSHCPTAQSYTKTSISNVQDNSDCPRLADKTMVLGPSGDVSGHSETTTTHMHSATTATEQPLPCQPNIPEPPHLVSWSSALQEHGFTAEVAERIAAPQRLSTRSIYRSKWTVFQCWCTGLQEFLYRGHLQLLLVFVQ